MGKENNPTIFGSLYIVTEMKQGSEHVLCKANFSGGADSIGVALYLAMKNDREFEVTVRTALKMLDKK